MTSDEIVALFVRALNLLTVVDDRVQLLAPRDMETIVRLAFLVAEQPEDTPIQCALVRLAAATAAVLTTSVIDAPDNSDIIREWRSAREEYEALDS